LPHLEDSLVERGGPVTLNWDVSNALSVGITRLSPDGIFLATEALGLPAKGSITLSTPEEYVTSVMYYLGARDANGVLMGSVHVGRRCRWGHDDGNQATQFNRTRSKESQKVHSAISATTAGGWRQMGPLAWYTCGTWGEG
jgi:hypothetical protein